MTFTSAFVIRLYGSPQYEHSNSSCAGVAIHHVQPHRIRMQPSGRILSTLSEELSIISRYSDTIWTGWQEPCLGNHSSVI